MGVEIERKFLVTGNAWREQVSRSESMTQAYLAGPPAARCSLRVRIIGTQAWLNLKSAVRGVVREEYEYPIPIEDADAMLDSFAGAVVVKRRHYVRVENRVFEIDEFEGDNSGLIVAEIELEAVDAPFPRPDWLGAEVSHLARYYNLHLASHPYTRWSASERCADVPE